MVKEVPVEVMVNVKEPCDCDNDAETTQQRTRKPTNEKRLDIKLSPKEIQRNTKT